jgi:glutamate carboxypeptidase
MKAGLVQALHALSDRPDASVTVLVTGDEETGSSTSHDLILEEAEGCAAVLVPEPSAEGGAIKLARKGIGFYQVDITGRAAHAGLEPERGANAAIAMAHAILAVCDLADLSAGTTVTPTLSAAGTTANTVPDFATFRVDVRAETAAEQGRVRDALHALKTDVEGAELIVRTNSSRAPLERSASRDLFALAVLTSEDLGLPALTGVAVGGASDGNLTAAAGIPTLDGLGPVGGGAHSRTEHVRASLMVDRALLLRGLMRRIATSTGR